jgi:hypothetical protein
MPNRKAHRFWETPNTDRIRPRLRTSCARHAAGTAETALTIIVIGSRWRRTSRILPHGGWKASPRRDRERRLPRSRQPSARSSNNGEALPKSSIISVNYLFLSIFRIKTNLNNDTGRMLFLVYSKYQT